jgi:hypothetical protein
MSKIQSTSRVDAPSVGVTAELSPPVQVVVAEHLEELRATMQDMAADDAQLRGSLLRDPKGTVAELVRLNSSGLYEMSESLEVTVLQDSEKVVNIVIPSLDKIDGMKGEIAEFARALDSDPKLLAALQASPRETIEAFMKGLGGERVELPADKAIKVFIEQSDQLYIVVPGNSAELGDMVTDHEIGAPTKFDPQMSCFTCECFTNGPCFTGQCFTAASCFTYSSRCPGT